jgi:hypothetical protein
MSQLQKLDDDDSFRKELVASISEDSSIKTERESMLRDDLMNKDDEMYALSA